MVKLWALAPVVLVVGMAAGSVLGAPESSSDSNAPQTLGEYLQYAALHNAGLRAAFEEWKAALEQVPQAKALPDPKFTYSYFIEQLQNRQQVGVMQTFPWFGKIAARTDAAAAAANAAQKRYEARKLQLFFAVKEAFYEYVYLGRAGRITRENLELMRHFEAVTRTKHITGTAVHPDVIRSQIEVAELQNELISIERMREPTVARLNAALNRPAESPLPWPRPEPAPPVELERRTLIASLKEANPELQAAGFDVERLRREVDVAKRSFYPEIGLGAEWMAMNMGPGARDDDVRVALELNLPLWRSSYRAGEMQARALARRAEHERLDLENNLSAQVERILYEFEDSGRRVGLYRGTLIPIAKELIGTSEAAYLAGTVDFLSLIEAERTLLKYRLEEERASTNRQQRLAELEMLVGADLSCSPADRTVERPE